MRTGKIDMHRFVEIVSTNPAKMFGLWPRKGTIAVGSDGDLVLFDPEKETTLSAKTHHMKVDYNPYEGRKVKGGPAMVLSRGEVIVDHGEFKGRKGRGQFVKRQPGAAARGVSPAPRPAASGMRRARAALPSWPRPHRRPPLQRGPGPDHDRAAHLDAPTTIAALWICMAHCIPTYMLASGLIDGGHELVAGAPHDPARQRHRARPDAAERARGHEVRHPLPGLRARELRHHRRRTSPRSCARIVACGWFGIQTWIGGQALQTFFTPSVPGWPTLLGAERSAATPRPSGSAFLLFWALNILIVYKGMELAARASRTGRRRSCS